MYFFYYYLFVFVLMKLTLFYPKRIFIFIYYLTDVCKMAMHIFLFKCFYSSEGHYCC